MQAALALTPLTLARRFHQYKRERTADRTRRPIQPLTIFRRAIETWPGLPADATIWRDEYKRTKTKQKVPQTVGQARTSAAGVQGAAKDAEAQEAEDVQHEEGDEADRYTRTRIASSPSQELQGPQHEDSHEPEQDQGEQMLCNRGELRKTIAHKQTTATDKLPCRESLNPEGARRESSHSRHEQNQQGQSLAMDIDDFNNSEDGARAANNGQSSGEAGYDGMGHMDNSDEENEGMLIQT